MTENCRSYSGFQRRPESIILKHKSHLAVIFIFKIQTTNTLIQKCHLLLFKFQLGDIFQEKFRKTSAATFNFQYELWSRPCCWATTRSEKRDWLYSRFVFSFSSRQWQIFKCCRNKSERRERVAYVDVTLRFSDYLFLKSTYLFHFD